MVSWARARLDSWTASFLWTVYRLTSEKAWNVDELQVYAELVSLGNPDFIEVKFKIDGEWWTWIDYSRFQELIQAYEDSNGSETFSAQDYMAKTPQWALFGASERSFDPKDIRHQRKNKSKGVSGH